VGAHDVKQDVAEVPEEDGMGVPEEEGNKMALDVTESA